MRAVIIQKTGGITRISYPKHRALKQTRMVGTPILLVSLLFSLSACSNEKLLPNGTLSSPNLSNGATLSGATKTTASAYGSGTKEKSQGGFSPFTLDPGSALKKRVILKNPTLAQVMQTGPMADMSIGRKEAPVTIIKYASLTCPHCRWFHQNVFPKLKRNYIDKGKVRFIIREFPIGHSSGMAAIALRCAPPEKYFTLYGKFLSQQSTWVSQEVRLDKIYKVARQVGLSRAQFDACMKNQDMLAGLKWIKDRGRTLGVIGTPNFFIQNELVRSVLTYDKLRERIDKLLGAPVASKAAPQG